MIAIFARKIVAPSTKASASSAIISKSQALASGVARGLSTSRRHPQFARCRYNPRAMPCLIAKQAAQVGRDRRQTHTTTGVEQGGVDRFAQPLPSRPAEKLLERLRARRHVQKTSQPDKSVWI